MKLPTLVTKESGDLLQMANTQTPTWKTLAKWFCLLSLGEWPRDIAHPGPENWLNLETGEKLQIAEVKDILEEIQKRVPRKVLARTWHTQFDPDMEARMMPREFEGWWADGGWEDYIEPGQVVKAA